LGEALVDREHAWTQFAGWSPDGTRALVLGAWESPENAHWEEEHRDFRFVEGGWLADVHLIDLAGGRSINLTGVERVSSYNGGVFFWPGDPEHLGFTALIDGISHPFRMQIDGTQKVDLTEGKEGFTYGFSASPDGLRIAYHKDYQIYLADADGSNVVRIETGQPFNFVPQWSADGQRVLFLSGEHYNCHPHVVNRDGMGLTKVADRNGYRGVVEFLDVFDFHGGSSDVPIWAADGQSLFFTRQEGDSIELFQATLNGAVTQLTHSPPGTHNYHPTPSRDGEWLVFGTNRTGARQLEVMHLPSGRTHALTQVPPGHGAMWPHWQPQH
ncbi:MAG: PD40 domain-containing protein, partial [Planctomycetaceae bacterium]|nr:PD40 domain-containing protein [Planctomycetaceae bacterium]